MFAVAIRKPELRQRARALREQGWTLRRIANDAGVALSTVSLWVRDIPTPAGVTPAPEAATAIAGARDEEPSERRRCGKCLQELPLTSFNRHPTGHQWWCRDCYRAYFQARGNQHRHEVSVARRKRRQVASAFLSEYLQTRPCADCGETDARVLEFHHLQQKRGNVADLVRLGSSIRLIRQELAKCIVLCANCHRIRTSVSVGSWRLDPESVDHDYRLTSAERRNRIYLRDFLEQSQCVDCGDARLVVLEFDHRGNKEANVTDLARRGCSRQRLEAEVGQCEIRCANCHRRRTAPADTSGLIRSG